MEMYPTTSGKALAAPAVTHTGVGVLQQSIGMANGAFRISGAAFRVTDDVVPGLRVWSPPA